MSFFDQANSGYQRDLERIRQAGYPIADAGMFEPRGETENHLIALAGELSAAHGRISLVTKGHKLVDGQGQPVLDDQGGRLDENMDQLVQLAAAAKDKLESAAAAAYKMQRDEQANPDAAGAE